MEGTVPSINLLPKKGESFFTHFFNWTISIGRLLIILTEFVALATFLSRFSLDMQIVDLHDKIKRDAAMLTQMKPAEENFRNLHTRLELIEKYKTLGSRTPTLFTDIANLGRGNITFKNLTVGPDTVKIEAQAISSSALSQFTASLKNQPSVTSVSIDKVENETSKGMITVSITATLEKAAYDKSTPENNQRDTDRDTQQDLNMN